MLWKLIKTQKLSNKIVYGYILTDNNQHCISLANWNMNSLILNHWLINLNSLLNI